MYFSAGRKLQLRQTAFHSILNLNFPIRGSKERVHVVIMSCEFVLSKIPRIFFGPEYTST